MLEMYRKETSFFLFDLTELYFGQLLIDSHKSFHEKNLIQSLWQWKSIGEKFNVH